ncbi:hypothetical protein FHX74_000887 [Friedmanniella endophytica]|uniref:Enoyl reductase (ER) domain-containing protein n=1 Tax=Microlunatus kandeliicorticis TaxID=1759536 RepID=A0A7W3IQB4_9ACTN|nr:NADP-dependent oxidoreductase [Microlunatus kandeliicorticis]MBA8793293.1 hypothetical protein [Microlunatus kandeliicorticis]
MSTQTREIHLAARPHGTPTPDDFRLVETTLPDPGPGQLLVRNRAMSVDPYMRGRMNDSKSYVAPFRLDAPLEGGAVGEVVAAGPDTTVEVGTLVLHNLGWREHALVAADAVQPLREVPGASPSHYLGVLGMPGLTAYAGLFRVGALQAGETVFVSGAAGAVGSLVGQFARLGGAGRVVGSAGSAEKVAFLTDELHFDAAFDYHDGPVRDRLREAAPDGIDVYFDNVGGEQLEAAIGALRLRGRGALCGAISAYNATEPPPGPRNLGLMVSNRLRLEGFLVGDHRDLQGEFAERVGGWFAAGDLVVRETVREGLDSAVGAFLGLLAGENTGKMVVTF